MSVPMFLFVSNALIALLLIALGGATRSAFFFWLLALLLWPPALMSSTFVWWSLLERGAADKWALYGILNVSVPLIASGAAASVFAVLVARLRDVRACVFLYALIVFLALQLCLSILAA